MRVRVHSPISLRRMRQLRMMWSRILIALAVGFVVEFPGTVVGGYPATAAERQAGEEVGKVRLAQAEQKAAKAPGWKSSIETSKIKSSSEKKSMPAKGAPQPVVKSAAAEESPAKSPAVDPKDVRGAPAGQLQPQAHASNGGITTCVDSLARASSQAVDGEHQAFSFWDPNRPNEGTFRSIVSLRYPNPTAPRGVAVIINSPNVGSTCDATTLQVLPTARTCAAIQSDIMKNGRAIANLTGLALIQAQQDVTYMLLPTAGDGCTIVAIRSIRSQ